MGTAPRRRSPKLTRLVAATLFGSAAIAPAAEILLDHGDRADVDLAIEGSAPALRLLLPEAILADGLDPVGGVHGVAGSWVRSERAIQGWIRPRPDVACLVRLEPLERDVRIAIAVKNLSRKSWTDVRLDLCANLCRLPKTWKVAWSNRDFIPERIPLDRDAQGRYWYREATPRRLEAWDPDRGWIQMHPRPESPEPPENPYQAELSESDRSLACAIPSLDGKRFAYMAWRARRSRHQSPFSGNACMHLRPQVAASLAPGESATLFGAAGIFEGTREDLAKHLARVCAQAPPVDRDGRPRILKHGTIDLDLVETTPILFRGRLLRFEWVRAGYWNNTLKENYFRFVDVATGETTPPFARGYAFGSAFVEGDTVYVTGTFENREVHVFASRDLASWDTWPAIAKPGYRIFNTSLTKAGDDYVLMFEIDRPAEEAGVPFTARFARSRDLRSWTISPPECSYARDRYSAPHCLRYHDGWFYDFYLEAHQGYEMRVVRSRDLVAWKPSPLQPVLRASPEDKLIANPALTSPQREKIAAARNINNSDLDLCEWNGRLYITYSWGNQEGTEFLAEATYEGTLAEFLRGWFPDG